MRDYGEARMINEKIGKILCMMLITIGLLSIISGYMEWLGGAFFGIGETILLLYAFSGEDEK